jgi:pyruvate dehydrogenase E2 component (dihydrolipoamide acetyltransferase)
VKQVTMPKLGPSMEEGTVVKWHKAEGEAVSAGEPLVDIETDKTVVEVEAETAGILRKVFAHDGEKLPVGTVLGLVGGADEPLAEAATEAPRLKASPSAKRRARELGVDLSDLAGSGPGGRITSEDVERARGVKADMTVAPNAMRRTIGERMAASKQGIPHFYVGLDVDMSAVAAQRGAWKAEQGDAAPSINDILIWACARALKEHRALNSGWSGDRITLFSAIDIGFAMASGNGLVVPVVRAADELAPRQIAARTRELAQKLADRKLTPADTSEATFTLSNLGMFAVDWFIPIINPPQCAILAAGRVADRVVAQAGSVAVRPVMTLTLSADHRIVDGVAAGRFLQTLKTLLERFTDG